MAMQPELSLKQFTKGQSRKKRHIFTFKYMCYCVFFKCIWVCYCKDL